MTCPQLTKINGSLNGSVIKSHLTNFFLQKKYINVCLHKWLSGADEELFNFFC